MCKAVDDLKAMGLREGLRKGRAEGLEKGLVDVATRALNKGMKHSDIQELTGFTQWRISRIAKQIRLGAKG